jgi:hypothetical protein
MSATATEPARLDFDEYIVSLADAMLDFADDAEDREAIRRIAQRIIVNRGGA